MKVNFMKLIFLTMFFLSISAFAAEEIIYTKKISIDESMLDIKTKELDVRGKYTSVEVLKATYKKFVNYGNSVLHVKLVYDKRTNKPEKIIKTYAYPKPHKICYQAPQNLDLVTKFGVNINWHYIPKDKSIEDIMAKYGEHFASQHWGIVKTELIYMGLLNGKPMTDPQVRITRLSDFPIITHKEKNFRKLWIENANKSVIIHGFKGLNKKKLNISFSPSLDYEYQKPKHLAKIFQTFNDSKYAGLGITIKEWPDGTDMFYEFYRNMITNSDERYNFSFEKANAGIIYKGKLRNSSSRESIKNMAMWYSGGMTITITSGIDDMKIFNAAVAKYLAKLPSSIDGATKFRRREWITEEINKCFGRMERCNKYGKPMRFDWFTINYRDITSLLVLPDIKKHRLVKHRPFSLKERKIMLLELKALLKEHYDKLVLSKSGNMLIVGENVMTYPKKMNLKETELKQ